MKKVVLVHCWGGSPKYAWYSSFKIDLEERGYEVVIPDFGQENPVMNVWVPKIYDAVGSPSENVVLVGHSVGWITILRYLESLEQGQKIGGAVLVAGFTDSLRGVEGVTDDLENYFKTEVDFEGIKEHCTKFVAIHSDNDKYVDLRHGKIFEEKLGAELIVINGAGHFSSSTKELPIVAQKVLEFLS